MKWCRTCGQPWRPHGRQPACPRCGGTAGGSGVLDAWWSLLLGGAFEGRGPLLLLRLALWPPVLAPLEERRRCASCPGVEQFGPALPCARCGGETVGSHLPSVADGSDLRAQRAGFLRGPGRPCLIGLAVVWLGCAGLIVRAFAHYEGLLRPLLALLGWGGLGVMLHVALVQVVRATRLLRARSPDAPLDPAALARAREELVDPFLERHAVEERGSLERAGRELDLLEQALAERGLALPAGRTAPFVAACALVRDQARYAARVRAERDQAGVDLVTAHARLVDAGADEALLPALQDLLVGEGEPLSGLASRLRAARERLRLDGFQRDLERRRGQGRSPP